MSRGPGRIERAITMLFDENPDMTFSVAEIGEVVFPDEKLVKKHRVSILRAALTACDRCGWSSGGYLGHMAVFFNPLSDMSRTVAEVRCEDLKHLKRVSHAEAFASRQFTSRQNNVIAPPT